MTGVNAPAGRSYGGRSGDERAAERRAALVDAAFAFGAREGWRALRIEPLCREAGLNKRYFYESFKDVDEVVAAVLDHLTTDVIAVSTGAIVPGSPGPRAIRDAVRAFVGHLTEDPRRARVLFGAVPGADAAADVGAAAIRRVIEAVAADGRSVLAWGEGADPLVDLAAAFVVGGTSQAVLDWLDGRVELPLERFADDVVGLWQVIADGAQARRAGGS